MGTPDKIHRVSWPYFWLGEKENQPNADWVVFFGADFKNLSVNRAFFVEKTNACLDYIRKYCSGHTLIYRPHPDEKDESSFLNLEGFSIQKDGQIAETFLLANRNKIKYVFSSCSTSSIAGFNLGLNAYSFYPYFRDIFKNVRKIFSDKYFSNLPSEFFIQNLDAVLLENKTVVIEDQRIKERFKSILSEHKGPVYFTIVENRLIVAIIGLARMVKEIFPGREVNLIVSGHHRWSREYLKELEIQFDKILFFPRHFYSLKPSKLLAAFSTARKIKNFKIEKGSILVGFAHHDFVENCFMSYNKDKARIAFLPEKIWELNFKVDELGIDPKTFKFNKASFFYNKIFEPLLGLNRTVFAHYGGEDKFVFIKYQKPIEEVYDEVFLMKNSPNDK